MSLPLPKHFSNLTLKDPDAAVCSCMAKALSTAADREHMASTGVTVSRGVIGCGMTHYSPLGTEMWGRSLLVFHPFDISASGLPVLRLSHGRDTIVTKETEERHLECSASSQPSVPFISSIFSSVNDVNDSVEQYSTDHVDNPALNSDENSEALSRKRKSASSAIPTALCQP